ncbi:MAG: flagellar hook-associated protein FlgL [Proteobacteria bacterium]|nr:flagellar hook-associated protein FlgL [Pseudomonadota bacterium]MBS0495966.1 flagellar hook-associated protein FlgL [Pseudomonadota bacterium]
MSSSFFRVSTANLFDSSVRNLGTRQKTLSDLQENLTSGKRVVRPSDDPVAAAQAERALTRISRIQTEQRALEVQRNAIGLAESTLGDAVGLVQEMRTLMVGAGGGALNNADRQTYAKQIESLQEQLRGVINRKDTNGMPLLGALGSALEPFAGPLAGSPDYLFAGLPGQAASNGTSIATTVDGHAALMFDPRRDGVYQAGVGTVSSSSNLGTSAVTPIDRSLITGNDYRIDFTAVGPGATPGTSSATYTITNTTTGAVSAPVTVPDYPSNKPAAIAVTGVPGLSLSVNGNPAAGDSVTLKPSASLMSSIDSAVNGIANATNSTQAAQAVGQALAHMDAGLERLSNIRGYAGELLNRADRITGDQEKRSIQLEADRSRAEDLDMLKGISDFQNANTGLEAALKSYAQVQRLSLFNYING